MQGPHLTNITDAHEMDTSDVLGGFNNLLQSPLSCAMHPGNLLFLSFLNKAVSGLLLHFIDHGGDV